MTDPVALATFLRHFQGPARPSQRGLSRLLLDLRLSRKRSARQWRRSSGSGPAIGAGHRPRVHSGVAAGRLLHAIV